MTDDGTQPTGSLRARRARVAGMLATAVGLLVLWLLSTLDASVGFPPAALGDALVRTAPGESSVALIEALGHWAKRLLIAGSIAGALLVGAEALVRSARAERIRPLVAGVVLALAGLITVLFDPSATTDPFVSAIALVAIALLYAAIAAVLYSRFGAGRDVDLSRRRALVTGTGGLVAIAAAGGALGWVTRRLRGPDRDVTLVAASEPAVVPSEGEWPDIPGLTPEITSAGEHYVVDINLWPPLVEVEGWTLTVAGEVGEAQELTFASLQESFEVVQEYSVMACISNEVGGELTGHSAWGGVRLADVLERAGAATEAMDVVFYAADGYSDSIPMEIALDPSVLLAVSQNGEPLTQEHGFPCRVRVPAIYGMKNVKWLDRIEVVRSDYKGYWMDRGWSDSAVVKTSSRVDVAGDDERTAVFGSPTWVAGVAWAGARGIESVEVSTDGGRSWTEAMLKRAVAPASWRLWAYRWTPAERGTQRIVVRATDGNGALQARATSDPFPSGATGYHAVEVSVV